MAKTKVSRKLAQGNDLQGALFEPTSDWALPTADDLQRFYNRCVAAKHIGFDTECRDPNLRTKGPGSFRCDGYLAGISLAVNDVEQGSDAIYLPLRHLAGGNGDNSRFTELARDCLALPAEKVGCHTLYDIEWLNSVGIPVRGRIQDVALAEALIDEESETGYSLDALSKKYGHAGKDETLLRHAAGVFNVDPKGELWKLHSRYVGPYAERDAINPLLILQSQQPHLDGESLQRVYDMECELTPIVWEMRKLGVRVDLGRATDLSTDWQRREDEIAYKILQEYGCHLDPWSAKEIAKICDRLKLEYPRTEKGNPSFEQEFIERVNHHPFFGNLRQLRRYNSLRSRFIDGQILSNQINGRVHCQFHQLRGDENGVRGGRFSSTGPNLQQVPGRDPDLAPLIRGLYIPEEGCDWAKLDYSQQEPRLVVHYAYLCKFAGANLAREIWIKDPSTDFYKYIADVAQVIRKDAKTIYLGRSYGMGKRKLAQDLGRTEDEAQIILDRFDERSPYVKELANKCMRQVERTGRIRTIGGRVCHFDHWVSCDRSESNNFPIRGRERAETHWPLKRIQRAFTHKALNRLIQGSAGDMTKMAIIKNYRDHGAVPHLTVHDELDYSVSSREQAAALKFGMEKCVECTIPIVAELEYGRSWK